MTLTDWWARLEAAPGFGGPRRYVHDLLGVELARVLETGGVLRQVGIARNYPCEERAGDHCPRAVIEIDGAHHAVCGNRPVGCCDLVLTEREAGLLTTNMMSLCRIIGSTLGTRGSPERIRDLSGVHRVGSIIPGPGIRYPVYLVIRSNAQSYTEAFGALVGRQARTPFSMLVPTGRFLTDQIEHEAQTRGVVILTLDDILVLVDGRFACAVDPETLFSDLGQRPRGSFGAGQTVARALVCNGKSQARWQELDEKQYQALLADASSYDVFADEKTKTVRKKGFIKENIPQSYFRSIEAALCSRAHFDPTVAGPELVSGKQLFQRARQYFDIKSGASSWKMFKTVRTEERHSVYAFRPDSDVSFALIFLAAG
jgi:hypothetical protein